MRPAPVTFETKLDADMWLKGQTRDVERGVWAAPEVSRRGGLRLRQYAETWLADRDLKPSTRALYRGLLDDLILPPLGDAYLDKIGPTSVRAWHASLNAGTPTRRAHAYSLLRSIYSTAVADDLVDANPCRVKGAGAARKVHDTRPATLAELEVIVDTIPARYQAMVLLAAWCGLRFGELTELRRSDVDVTEGLLRVQRGVTRVDGAFVVGDPKSEAGRRSVAIPPHLMSAIRKHLTTHTGPEPGALLFPARDGGHMQPSTLYKVWYPAREAAGRNDLRFHDLRHTGATLAAATGATLKELMARIGHSTPAAAMRYQHAAAGRDRAIAEALSGFAKAKVVPLRRARGKSA
jgi:integrase